MEASQPLSVSYGWSLVNRNHPSLDSPKCSFRVLFDDSSSFIEMDPNLTPSKRFLVHQQDQDQDFHVPTSQSPRTTLVHADQLISNGIVLSHGFSSDSVPVSPLSSSTREDNNRFRKSRSLSLRRCNRLPKRIIQKYMDLVRPLWCRMTHRRSDHGRREGAENWECSSASGPRCWTDNRRRSCDSESSIHEAVVHCKKTIGMN